MSDYEDEDYSMEDDSGDESGSNCDEDVFDDPPVVSHHDCSFQVLTPERCLQEAQAQASRVKEMLCCDDDEARILLRHFSWDTEKLVDAYVCDPDGTRTKAGIHAGDDRSVLHKPDEQTAIVAGTPQRASAMPVITCQICFEPQKLYSALGCGHTFCNACYSQYIWHKIKDEGHDCVYARCPDTKCRVILSRPLVQSLVTDADGLRLYENAARIERSFVDDSHGIKWCPAPDCTLAVTAQGGQLGVRCACGERFCFKCMHADHRPCSCEELGKWLIKCRDDSETYNWLVANTKACPKCATSIEKNGGCNHMTCKNTSCKYEFCWVCMGPWKEHSGSFYSCNKFDPEKDKGDEQSKKKDSSRQALERYLHYYTRYTNHHNSLKLEMEAKVRTEEKIKEMEKLGDNTWMDCQYLNEANEALNECRYALQYTYVFAYYLPQHDNFRHHFEMQQMELEKQTEDLSEELEKSVELIDRMVVVHCFQMAKKRLEKLFELVDSRAAASLEQEQGSSSDQRMDP